MNTCIFSILNWKGPLWTKFNPDKISAPLNVSFFPVPSNDSKLLKQDRNLRAISKKSEIFRLEAEVMGFCFQ